MNVCPVTVSAADANAAQVTPEGEEPIAFPVEASGVELTLGVRPEAFRPDEAGQVSGEMRHIERLGRATLTHFAPAAVESIIAQGDGSAEARIGRTIRFSVDPDGCHLFGMDSKALPGRVQHPLAA